MALPMVYKERAHIRLMVKPGMMTLAKACHRRVSTAAKAIFLLLESSSAGRDLDIRWALSFVSANCRNILC